MNEYKQATNEDKLKADHKNSSSPITEKQGTKNPTLQQHSKPKFFKKKEEKKKKKKRTDETQARS